MQLLLEPNSVVTPTSIFKAADIRSRSNLEDARATFTLLIDGRIANVPEDLKKRAKDRIIRLDQALADRELYPE